ncbi:DNA helicase [Trifolium repens]|nr:DNA helicase [Trifolium repens]
MSIVSILGPLPQQPKATFMVVKLSAQTSSEIDLNFIVANYKNLEQNYLDDTKRVNMAAFLNLLGDEPTATFLIIKLSNQLYPEIQPEFVEQHYRELKRKWCVVNNEGILSDLIWNKAYMHPLIKQGWLDFKKHSNLPENVEVKIGYYKPNVFKVISYRSITAATDIKKFHSRNIDPAESIFFDVPLTNEFTNFLDQSSINYVLLCGDNGLMEYVSPVQIEDTRKTSLGNPWEKFCQTQFFEPGNKIRFKFSLINSTGKCQVFKIPN